LANADGDAPPPLDSTSFADTETFSFPSSYSLQMQNVAGDSLNQPIILQSTAMSFKKNEPK
jgi:hypothetical protein